MYLVLGEALIDMVAGTQGDFSPVPGGGPYNFARALALQGVPTGYANPFSADAFGTLLKSTLEASGAMHLGGISARPTSLALVTTDARGAPQYTFYRDGVADRDLDVTALRETWRRDAIGFHTGALALVPPDVQHALDALHYFRRRRGTLCTVDVNMRPRVASSMGIPGHEYRAAVFDAITAANVVKVSDEDLVNLGLVGDATTEAVALLERGCDVVVLTLGTEGAWAFTRTERIHQPAVPVQAVDTVGAGDCFFAGFMASLHRQGALVELGAQPPVAPILRRALQHAAACAAVNISRKGCQPPTWEQAANWQLPGGGGASPD